MNQTYTGCYLQIENLWKAFGEFIALRDVTLDIDEGEFVCFLGPSGCGKTTLLRAIAGLDLQSRGRIVQEGRDISELPPAQRDFGIVFQSYALFPNLSIRRNIAFGLENDGRGRAEVSQRVDELLQLVGLPEQGDKYPAQLSGGQQQRIALARAIATSPGLLLLDEPLSALDAKVRVRLRHEIKALQRELGVTTIMVTHDQEEALAMADRIVVINEGAIEQTGTPTEVYRDPATLFVADFIGEMNQFKATAVGSRRLHIGGAEFHCRQHEYSTGSEVVAAIRPDNIVPHSPNDIVENGETNFHTVTLEDMEFLGSFWRCQLSNPCFDKSGSDSISSFENRHLTADFSANAVRRLDLSPGQEMVVQLPPENLMIFSANNRS